MSCVVVIDDDAGMVESLRLILELAGHRVVVFESAAAFLANGASQASCLILDHHMPQMTGLDLVLRLHAEHIHVPVLLITGRPSPNLLDRAAELGIEQVLVKPLNPDELLRFADKYSRP